MALHGGAQMWTGERQYTFSAQLIEQITGLPKEDAEQILGLVSIAGTAASANKVLETAANQYKLTEAQIAALRTEAGIDSKIVGSNKPPATTTGTSSEVSGATNIPKPNVTEFSESAKGNVWITNKIKTRTTNKAFSTTEMTTLPAAGQSFLKLNSLRFSRRKSRCKLSVRKVFS